MRYMACAGAMVVAVSLAACSATPSATSGTTPPTVSVPTLEPVAKLVFGNSIGLFIQKGTEGDRVRLINDRRGWAIEHGEILITGSQASGIPNIERSLRVDRVAVKAGLGVARVYVRDRRSLPDGAPMLVDSNGVITPASGYVYRAQDYKHVVFTPDRPLADIPVEPGMLDEPTTGRLVFIFVVDQNAHFGAFRVGGMTIESWPVKSSRANSASR